MGKLALLAWGAGTALVSGSLLSGHLLSLPVPGLDQPELARAIAEARSGRDTWTVLHALSSECGCSARVLDHLLSTVRPAAVTETVLLVGPPGDIPARVAAAGFRYEALTAESLDARYGIPAVPLLVIADATGALRYSGGYTDRKRGPAILDVSILYKLRGGGAPDALPLFGCPINSSLRASLDPLGLR